MVDVLIPLGSWTLPSLSYQLFTSHSCSSQRTQFKVKVMLWPMVSEPVSLCVKHPSGAQDKIFITIRHLQVCWCGAPSLMRGQVCRLQLLVALTSAVILNSWPYFAVSDSRLPPTWRARYPYLYPQVTGCPSHTTDTRFPLLRLLWLAGLQWRYSNPHPCGGWLKWTTSSRYVAPVQTAQKTSLPSSCIPLLPGKQCVHRALP
jgi:hypothetical protein